MKTGQHLKIQAMGENVLGVRLKGDPKNPEPIHFRVVLPFGDVDIVRTTTNDYWIHARVNHQDDGDDPYRHFGKFTDARIDLTSEHTANVNTGDFAHPDMYHMAVRLSPTGE